MRMEPLLHPPTPGPEPPYGARSGGSKIGSETPVRNVTAAVEIESGAGESADASSRGTLGKNSNLARATE